jgi:hypothetical protein
MIDQLGAEVLLRISGACSQARHAITHIADEMKTVELIQQDHIERRRRGAFLIIAAHMEVVMVRPAIREPMNQPWITMIGENNRFVRRKERVKNRGR